jgi:hypothetical protein
VADDGVEEAVGGGGIAGDVEAEPGGRHARGGAPDPVLPYAAVGEVDVSLVLEKLVQLLSYLPALKSPQISPKC